MCSFWVVVGCSKGIIREIAWVLLLVSKPEQAGLLVWGKIKKKKWDSGFSYSSPRATFLLTEEKASHVSEPLKRVH